jgi:hypothetical protein
MFELFFKILSPILGLTHKLIYIRYNITLAPGMLEVPVPVFRFFNLMLQSATGVFQLMNFFNQPVKKF